MTTEIFSGNANASVEILASLANQMQDYRGDVTEALVVAADDLGAHIYHIDKWSLVRCYDDVGFAAIGIGADHAKSQLMRARYSNQWPFSVALAIAYTSKKMSEVAPGVGTETDLFIVNKIGCVPVLPDLRSLVDTLYNEYETQRAQLVEEQLRKLREGIDKLREAQNRQRDAAGPEQSGAGDENPKPTTSGN